MAAHEAVAAKAKARAARALNAVLRPRAAGQPLAVFKVTRYSETSAEPKVMEMDWADLDPARSR